MDSTFGVALHRLYQATFIAQLNRTYLRCRFDETHSPMRSATTHYAVFEGVWLHLRENQYVWLRILHQVHTVLIEKRRPTSRRVQR